MADEAEYVRDTAYKAGQRLVTNYAESAITMLLPELEKGLFDENWRIRHSSVQLLGKETDKLAFKDFNISLFQATCCTRFPASAAR